MAKILTVSHKKTKLLTVNRKSHHPIETLLILQTFQLLLQIKRKKKRFTKRGEKS